MTEPEEAVHEGTGIEVDPLAPVDDVLEQRREVATSADGGTGVPLDANPADVAEQQLVVGDDEEEY